MVNGVQIHLAEGVHGKTVPNSATFYSSDLFVHFKTDALRNDREWRAVFSADGFAH